MKKVIGVQFLPWDKIYTFDPKDNVLKEGDYVVVKTSLGTELGKVAEIMEIEERAPGPAEKEIKPISRKANAGDMAKTKERAKSEKNALEICGEMIRKHNLPMKLIDASFSFDGGRITFAFTAKERIDFRKLVEDLTRHFQKSIRMQHIGIREGMKLFDCVGSCGRELCCKAHLKKLGNISLDLAHDQQIAHRKTKYLSGVCGRLLCCLAYEEEAYKELMGNCPKVGSMVRTEKGRGEVRRCHFLKQTIDVEVGKDVIVEVPLKKHHGSRK